MMDIARLGLPSLPSLEDFDLPAQFALPGRRPITSGTELTQRVASLVQSIEALLETNTVEAIVELAKELGYQEQINAGVDFLTESIEKIQAFFQSLKESLVHVSALGGLVQLLDPLVAGLEGLANTSADTLRETGLEQLNGVLEPAGTAFHSVRRVLSAGGETLRAVPSWDDVEQLRRDLGRLEETIARFKV